MAIIYITFNLINLVFISNNPKIAIFGIKADQFD